MMIWDSHSSIRLLHLYFLPFLLKQTPLVLS
ncbi:hypothetical protein GLYMA_18G013550v4 [Glycine max]|nr:hypothetical protein GLYMA_18G013550v4 [Glycine max]KAH1152699.1 hypothetical protein GYH30_048683 [Glycine max]